MKKIIILLLLSIPFVTTAQQSDSVWILNNYTKKEIYITMRDGVKLFTTVYMPKDVSENIRFC